MIVFEVIFNALTAGTASAASRAKFLSKFIKAFEDFNLDQVPKIFSKMLSTARTKAEQVGGKIASKLNWCKILGKGCFVKDTLVLMASNRFKNAAPAMALATMPLVAPIQNVKVDDMVKAYHHEEMYLTASNKVYPEHSRGNDIYVPGWQDYDYLDITPETWQVGKFIITEENGSIVEIEANRPKKWFDEYDLKKNGDEVWLEIEEMGVADYAVLQEIRFTYIDTRKIELNEHGIVDRPIITTYKRVADKISDYTFTNGQVISCTPNHPFYSSDRQAYIPIGELAFGETVQTSSDREVKFIRDKVREKGKHVYNFEVWREHNYYVGFEGGEDFALVHNSCPKKLIQDAINAKVDLRGFRINGKLAIPKDWNSSPLAKGDGFRFSDPTNPKIQMRVREKGTFPHQPHNYEKPYARYELGKDETGQMRHADIDGNLVPLDHPNYYEVTHFVLEDLTAF